MEHRDKKDVYQQILDYIIRYREEHDYSPVMREIREGIGCQSSSTVFGYLRDMKALGLIDYQDESPRTITVPGYHYRKAR